MDYGKLNFKLSGDGEYPDGVKEGMAKKIASLPDGTLEISKSAKWLSSALANGECEVPCKPKEHAEHDVLCSEDYDAHYCFTCDHWVEGRCDLRKCPFCKDRPEKMSKDS